MSIFDHVPQSELEIVAPDGTLRASTRGIFGKKQVTILDASVVIEPGDEIRRKLPNGREEVFAVRDPRFLEQHLHVPARYLVSVSRKGAVVQGTGGHYINVIGVNARVNIESVDQSTNVVHGDSVFGGLYAAIETVPSAEDRVTLRDAARRMESAQSTRSFKVAYQEFLSLAADHMTIIAPFIPALSMLL